MNKSSDPVLALQEWYEKERATNGLRDIKLYPGANRDVSNADAARLVVQVMTGEIRSTKRDRAKRL